MQSPSLSCVSKSMPVLTSSLRFSAFGVSLARLVYCSESRSCILVSIVSQFSSTIHVLHNPYPWHEAEGFGHVGALLRSDLHHTSHAVNLHRFAGLHPTLFLMPSFTEQVEHVTVANNLHPGLLCFLD